MADRFQIRPASAADAPEVARLERRCFSDPWSEAGIREMLANPGVVALAATVRDGIAGYAIARWVADTGEILNLAVAPEHRRRGLARRLLDAELAALASRGVRDVFLEVRESNQAAQSLYQAKGFRLAGMRRAYYRSPSEDAMVFKLRLDGAAF